MFRRPRVLVVAAAAVLWPPVVPAVETTREDVQAFIRDAVGTYGLDAEYLRTALSNARSQPGILEAMAKPAERTKTWSEYRAIFITPARIEAGRSFWAEHDRRLTRISGKSGVPVEILVGILGVETYFGRRAGSYRVLDALATLAFEYPPRSKFFQSELAQFLLLVRDERLPLDTLNGSYAGAMGPPQFMPSSYRRYAVDADGDGRRDLFASWDDILESVANYLVAHDWQQGQAVATRSTLAEPLDLPPADNKLAPGETVATLAGRGVRFSTDLGPATPAGLIALEGEDGPEYWVAFHNFYVITRYNRSVMYALAVHQLGQSIGEAVRSGPDGSIRRTDAL